MIMINTRADIKTALEKWDQLIDAYDGNFNKSHEFILEHNEILIEALCECVNLAEDLYTGEL